MNPSGCVEPQLLWVLCDSNRFLLEEEGFKSVSAINVGKMMFPARGSQLSVVDDAIYDGNAVQGVSPHATNHRFDHHSHADHI